MNTDELVRLLAASGGSVDRAAVRMRFWLPIALAVFACVAAVLATVGPRADWREASQAPMFWLKLGFPAIVAAAALAWLRDLGRPGVRRRGPLVVLAASLALVWLMAAGTLAAAAPPARAALVMGNSWLQCLVSIPLLAIPAAVLAFVAARSLAPTRLRLAGAAAGLVAGGVAAFAYALYCNETQAPFLAAWYVLGMLIPAASGAAVGPRALRW